MNKTGRVIIIGDIHGCIRELDELLGLLKIVSSDSLYFIGDLIDRGPDPAAVVRRCRQIANECATYLILGNHEEKFLRWLQHCRNNTGMETQMKGTEEFPALLKGLSNSDIEFLHGAYYSLALKEENITLLHGGIFLSPKFPFPETYRYDLHSPKELKGLNLITKIRYISPDGKFVSLNEKTPTHHYWADLYDGSFGHIFFGHQAFIKDTPKEFPHATCLDTGCVYGGWLNAAVLKDGLKTYFSIQSKERYSQNINIQGNI
jgi:serine/threonine protein phosphatase 1